MKFLPALAGTFALLAIQAHAAIIYTTNFDEYTVNTLISSPTTPSSPFTESNTSTGGPDSSIVAISGADHGLRQSVTATGGGSSIAAMTQSGLTTTGGGFSISATFILSSFTLSSSVANVNLYAATDSVFGSGYRLSYNLGGTGNITMSEQNANPALSSNSAGAIAPSTGGVITLTMVGLYNSANSVTVTGYLYNASGTLIGSTTITDTTPALGTSYGLRTATANNAITTVTFTSYTLESVPEPSAAALVALAGVALGFRRRRA